MIAKDGKSLYVVVPIIIGRYLSFLYLLPPLVYCTVDGGVQASRN